MRASLTAALAWQDYRADSWLSACSVLALVAVIAVSYTHLTLPTIYSV